MNWIFVPWRYPQAITVSLQTIIVELLSKVNNANSLLITEKKYLVLKQSICQEMMMMMMAVVVTYLQRILWVRYTSLYLRNSFHLPNHPVK